MQHAVTHFVIVQSAEKGAQKIRFTAIGGHMKRRYCPLFVTLISKFAIDLGGYHLRHQR